MFPNSDFFGLRSEGFWGWCDFAGGLQAGDDADCQIAEYMRVADGTSWTCELNADGSWAWAPEVFDPTSITFHMTGSLVIRNRSLTADERAACANFFTGRTDGSTTFTNADTFIPTVPGHYNIPPSVIFPPGTNVVGEFNFTVKLNPTA